MAIFDIDFVFSCPFFIPDVLNAIERSTKKFEIAAFVNRNHVVKNFEVHSFKNEKSMFICCFDNLLDGIHFDTKNCCIITGEYFFECIMTIHLIR